MLQVLHVHNRVTDIQTRMLMESPALHLSSHLVYYLSCSSPWIRDPELVDTVPEPATDRQFSAENMRHVCHRSKVDFNASTPPPTHKHKPHQQPLPSPYTICATLLPHIPSYYGQYLN